jgi:hypothetical protein
MTRQVTIISAQPGWFVTEIDVEHCEVHDDPIIAWRIELLAQAREEGTEEIRPSR